MSTDDGSGDWRRESGSCSALGGSGDDEEDDKVMDGEERRDCDQPDVEMVLLFPAYFFTCRNAWPTPTCTRHTQQLEGTSLSDCEFVIPV
jgi:hypothetical protein